MKTIKTSYNRRSFLKVSATASGGMLLGFSFLAGCKSEVIEKTIKELELPESWFDINAFIKIGENGVVTILSQNPEIGQNVKTSMPMIIAEELDVDWKNVLVEQAPLNTSKYKRQLAGGSQSIRSGWKSLRIAGATARRMLLEVAAKQLEVPVNELTTEKGVIHHKATSKTIGYGEVALAASTIEIPEEVELKDPKDFKIIGHSTLNVDGRGIVTGKPLFGMDYEEEGMLIAMVAHPPAFGMKIESFNKDEVLAMPGIVDVIELDLDWYKETNFIKNALYKNNMVAIVGESTWQVMKAKKALKIEFVSTSKQKSTTDYERELVDLLSNDIKPARVDGNAKKAFKNAAKIIERTYSAPFVPHNTMAPMNFFADIKEDSARLVGPIQAPDLCANLISKKLNIPRDKVSLEMTRMGGGFGRRLYGNFVFEAAYISKVTKKPIKIIYTREDDMMNGTYRPTYKVNYKAALDKNNKLTAFTAYGAGAHGGPVFPPRFPAGTVPNYEAGNARMESNISTGAWRAPKSNFIAGAEQSFIDEIAEAAGKDPIDFRLELFQNALDNPVGKKNGYEAERYIGVLKLVKEKADWGKEKAGVHRGVAAYFCHNSYVAQIVDIIIKDNKPVIEKVWCAVDCGIVINPTAAKSMIEGGTIDGIGNAMFGGLTIKDGIPEQNNFDTYRMIRNQEAPLEIETFFIDNGIDPTGLGEPGLPAVVGALANALYKATGERLYTQPFVKQNNLLG